MLNNIIAHIDSLINYLQKYLPLANFHMVNYFINDGFKNYIPDNIQQEIASCGYDSVLRSIFTDEFKYLPSLHSYIQKSREFTLKNCSQICLTTDSFQEKLKEWGCQEFLRHKLYVFMNSKKSHEVDVLSFIVAALRSITHTSHLIDIGDGKGYLSSMLALYHKIPVLGVDASPINTDGAIKRVKKLSKVWNSLTNTNNKTRETSAELYKQVTKFVDKNVNFKDLVADVFLETPNGLGLVGLHTCGNLAATSFRIFSANEDIRMICNVGCCYHLIDEAFDPSCNNMNISGFPLSNYLNEKKFSLGRAARMIAAQSIERILEKRELPNKMIFYRALFEIFLEEQCPDLPQNKRHVGRFRKQTKTFKEYTSKAMERLNLDIRLQDKDINGLFERYEHREGEIYLFYLVRNMLSPIIESLILLDRLLFLHERGYSNSFLVHLFDPTVSPRCYGIVSIK